MTAFMIFVCKSKTFFTQSFSVYAPTELQMKLIDRRSDEFIKKKYYEIPQLFYRNYVPSEKFPKLKKNVARIIFLLGSMYVS